MSNGSAPDQRLEFTPPRHASQRAIYGCSVLRRIRDAVLEAHAKGGVKPAKIAIQRDALLSVIAFWSEHFPDTHPADLPRAMFGIPFVEGRLSPGELFAFGYRVPPTQH